jgi:hypothetical protein
VPLYLPDERDEDWRIKYTWRGRVWRWRLRWLLRLRRGRLIAWGCVTGLVLGGLVVAIIAGLVVLP